jgi:copper(I)-binding protein
MKGHVLIGLLLVISSLAIPCLASEDSNDNHLMVVNPHVRALLPGQEVTVAFLTIHNHGDSDCKLLSADSPIAQRIEFHTHLHKDGMMKMRPVEAVQLAAGSSVTFESGALHLMLFEVESSLNSLESTQINIYTDHCGSVSFDAPVTNRVSKPMQEMHH